MKINEKIYLLRKKHNLSQEELANKLNVSRQTVSKWETGESCPDFDKIVPLCEIFEISTEELIRDKKIEINDEKDEKVDVKKAVMISISIFLYFISIISLIIGEVYFNLNEGLLVGIFLFICGIATGLIVFACMTSPSKKKNKKSEEDLNPALKSIIEITSLTFTCVYLLVSFLTMAWHITWIIWIIYSIVVEIIKLIFRLKEVNNNEQ